MFTLLYKMNVPSCIWQVDSGTGNGSGAETEWHKDCEAVQGVFDWNNQSQGKQNHQGSLQDSGCRSSFSWNDDRNEIQCLT